METIDIGGGLHLHFINTDNFKTTAICALMRRPLLRDEVTVNTLLPGILTRGCASYPSLPDINRALEELYGALLNGQSVKKGEEQILQFYIDLIDREELLPKGLELLRQVMLEPLVYENGFDRGYTDSEKENLRNSITGRSNNKKEYARYRALEEMCWNNGRNEPFGLYGDGFEEDLDGLDNYNLFQQYQNILNTTSLDIAVVGNVNKDFLTDKLSSLFHRESDNPAALPKPSGQYETRERQQIDEDQDLAQGKICFGFRTGVEPVSDEFYKLMCMNEILGGGGSSRLFINVREKENLCYYINSFIFRFKGIMFVESGVEAEQFDKAEELLLQNIRAIHEEGVSQEELEGAKTSLTKKFRSISDHPSSLLNFYIGQKMLGDENGIEDFIEKINRTSRDEVCDMAGRLHLDTVYRLK